MSDFETRPEAPGRLQNPKWSYADMLKRRDLTVIVKSIEKDLVDLAKDPGRTEEDIGLERAALELAQRELTKLEEKFSSIL